MAFYGVSCCTYLPTLNPKPWTCTNMPRNSAALASPDVSRLPARVLLGTCMSEGLLAAAAAAAAVCCVQVGPRQWERVLEMVRRIRGLGMEVRGLLQLSLASDFDFEILADNICCALNTPMDASWLPDDHYLHSVPC